ncbi:MAG: hypothetical protein AUK26_07740 [Syntrophaceae bacterium CG2_30_58_14]|nr:MAG: hypothetical protein AUK26_07740 [Syntrophaceae bacterium CG2_30_58_14]
MPLNEADTRAKLIDPAIHKCGWTEDLIRREETAGTVEIINGKARRRSRGKIDYVLRVKVNVDTQPVALALIEAKKENLPPGHGLDQAKGYAECRRHNVQFIFTSNGHLFVEFDCFTGYTSTPKPIAAFPSPAELRARYERGMGFTLESPAARPLLQRYAGGEGARRYYQDAAIRAVMEKIARCESTRQPKRALLSLATGAGKTFIAVNLLKRISDAGQLTRALFVCDRDELRTQALKAFQNVFGADAAEVYRKPDGTNNAKNARIHIATYQTLGIENENGDANFLTTHYPGDFFTHIVIDECHRSAWGKWSQVLTRNRNAVQIGLTATPRQLVESLKRQTEESETDSLESLPLAAEMGAIIKPIRPIDPRAPYGVTREVWADAEITANNLAYFGEPTYEYDIAQAIEDGYLAACEIQKGRVNLDYTDATRLFGEGFITKPTRTGGGSEPPPPPPPPEPTISVEGFDVHITDAGRFIVADVDGKAMPVPIEEYKSRLAARLVQEVRTLNDFRVRWIDPPSRQELIDTLVTSGYSPTVVRMVDDRQDYDLYDVLAELGWGMNPRTRRVRTLAFTYKNEDWLNTLSQRAAATIRAIASQFERGGTEGLENPQIFQTPEVRLAGGLAALQTAGNPRDLLIETKARMFTA